MMNVHKHMELIFGAVLGVACIAAALPDDFAAPAKGDTARAAAMPVVVIKAKRMTALEKRQSLGLGTGVRSAVAGS